MMIIINGIIFLFYRELIMKQSQYLTMEYHLKLALTKQQVSPFV